MAKLEVGALRDPRALAGQSLRKVAEAATSAGPYLEQVERSARGPAADAISQVARGLRHGVDALGTQAGLLADSALAGPAAPEPSDVREAVRADPGLTEGQRAVILDIYASFLEENARSAPDVRDR